MTKFINKYSLLYLFIKLLAFNNVYAEADDYKKLTPEKRVVVQQIGKNILTARSNYKNSHPVNERNEEIKNKIKYLNKSLISESIKISQSINEGFSNVSIKNNSLDVLQVVNINEVIDENLKYPSLKNQANVLSSLVSENKEFKENDNKTILKLKKIWNKYIRNEDQVYQDIPYTNLTKSAEKEVKSIDSKISSLYLLNDSQRKKEIMELINKTKLSDSDVLDIPSYSTPTITTRIKHR